MVTLCSDFQCGNDALISCEERDEGQYIKFRAETKYYEPQSNWFYFRLSGLKGSVTHLELANAQQCLDDCSVQGWQDNHPIYRAMGAEWKRVENVRVTFTPERCYKVTFDVPVEAGEMEFAFCYMSHTLAEEELIAYVKPYLKAKGFKKKNKRWTKDIGEFTLCFYIQGSCFSKEAYYIRPGIFVNALMPTMKTYGHWMFDIEQTTPEEVMAKFEKWCEEWTNKSMIRSRLEAFIEWEKRNPLEKRRAGLVDYSADPVPAREFFGIDIPPTEPSVTKYILDNF